VNLPSVLALDDVTEIVIVVDGSRDDTEQTLAAFNNERLHVVRHAHNQGQVAARKTGIAAAHGQWLIMLDDDCSVPPDFARILLNTAVTRNADIVGAPWLHPEPGVDLETAIDRARAAPGKRIGLSTSPSVFPADDLVTPFMSANALIN
jgi:glycosyltransferase involved in cell wall biosynthesis